jgi:hypothetical protein
MGHRSEKPAFIDQGAENLRFWFGSLSRGSFGPCPPRLRDLPAFDRPSFTSLPQFLFRPCRWWPLTHLSAAPFFWSSSFDPYSPLTRRFSPASADPSRCVLPSFLHRSGGNLRRSPGLRLAPVRPPAEAVRDMGLRVGSGEWRRVLHGRWDEGRTAYGSAGDGGRGGPGGG